MLERLSVLLEQHAADVEPISTARDALAAGVKSGTMRAWFTANDGRTVDTVQVSGAGNWGPTGRTIDASMATRVLLDGSARDYKGMRVVVATSRVLIVEGAGAAIAYILTQEV